MPRLTRRSARLATANKDADNDGKSRRAARLFKEINKLYKQLNSKKSAGVVHTTKKADYFRDFVGDGKETWDMDALEADAKILRDRVAENSDDVATARRVDDGEVETGARARPSRKRIRAAPAPSPAPARERSRILRSRRQAPSRSADADTPQAAKKKAVRSAAVPAAAPVSSDFALQATVTAMLGVPAQSRQKSRAASVAGGARKRSRISKPRPTNDDGVVELSSGDDESDDEEVANKELDLSRLHGVHNDVRRDFEFLRTLGTEGKDGQTFLCRVKTSATLGGGVSRKKGSLAAMKVFKKHKSISFIRNEMEMQRTIAAIGVAPPIVSTWSIDAKHRCFAMKALDRTLLQVLKDQNGKLTSDQQSQIIGLFDTLGEEGNIFHNDSNIARNMMIDDSDGRL